MKTYNLLSRIKFLKKYSVKFLFVAFLGIHIPLIGLIVYLIFADLSNINPYYILGIVLVMTLLATTITLLILNSLLHPILITKDYLNNYLNKNELGNLPNQYSDEVGILMRDVKFTITSLDELLSEKQDLIGLMSHDLKNPLAASMSYAEIIATDPKHKPIADKIIEASNTQKLIIESVLKMLEQGDVNIDDSMKESFDLKVLVNRVIERYKQKQEEKNIKVNTSLNSKNIYVNNDLISQVIENVYSNSLKFTENGEINISSEDIDNNNVKIIISDNGIGFEPEIAEKLFERFTKYKRKGTKNEATTGLGLYLCKKIVERHKGTIFAFSEGKNKGSKFEIILPAIK